MNMHYGIEFDSTAKKAVDAYGTYVMACKYNDKDGADLPVGWDASNATYIPSDLANNFEVIFDDSGNGNYSSIKSTS